MKTLRIQIEQSNKNSKPKPPVVFEWNVQEVYPLAAIQALFPSVKSLRRNKDDMEYSLQKLQYVEEGQIIIGSSLPGSMADRYNSNQTSINQCNTDLENGKTASQNQPCPDGASTNVIALPEENCVRVPIDTVFAALFLQSDYMKKVQQHLNIDILWLEKESSLAILGDLASTIRAKYAIEYLKKEGMVQVQVTCPKVAAEEIMGEKTLMEKVNAVSTVRMSWDGVSKQIIVQAHNALSEKQNVKIEQIIKQRVDEIVSTRMTFRIPCQSDIARAIIEKKCSNIHRLKEEAGLFGGLSVEWDEDQHELVLCSQTFMSQLCRKKLLQRVQDQIQKYEFLRKEEMAQVKVLCPQAAAKEIMGKKNFKKKVNAVSSVQITWNGVSGQIIAQAQDALSDEQRVKIGQIIERSVDEIVSTRMTLRIPCRYDMVGVIIGKEGQNIHRVKEEAGLDGWLSVEWDHYQHELVLQSHKLMSEHCIKKIRQLVQDKINEFEVRVRCQQDMTSNIRGERGSSLRHIKTKAGIEGKLGVEWDPLHLEMILYTKKPMQLSSREKLRKVVVAMLKNVA